MSTIAPDRGSEARDLWDDLVEVEIPSIPDGLTPGLESVTTPSRRRSPAVPALVAVGIVVGALLALAAVHALLISGQLHLDQLRRDAAAETETIRQLERQVAELESPQRILERARDRLGMVQPQEVGYLVPLGSDEAGDRLIRVPPAEVPPATTLPDEAQESGEHTPPASDTVQPSADPGGDGDDNGARISPESGPDDGEGAGE